MRMQIALSWITVGSLLLAATSQASGQHYQPFGDLEVHHDLQLFAPPIIDEYGDEPVAPNYGWFLDYSRAYINLNRPDNVPSHYQGDFTWGNIWDIGYMTEDNHGWMMSILHFNTTSVYQVTPVADIQGNVFNTVNNLNAGKYGGVELNKTFRAHVGDHGTYFEPFGGLRFGKFEEALRVLTVAVDNPANPIVETTTWTNGLFENNMIGGQLGLRSYMRRGHWVISSEIRGFGMNNFQFLDGRQIQQVQRNLGPGNGFLIQNPTTTTIAENHDEFVVGGELRLEAAYEITREVRAQVGLEVLHFGRGIGRGVNQAALSGAGLNDQAVTYAGVFFGIQINH